MPAPLAWTAAMDEMLTALRREGRTWDGIAGTLGVSRWTAIERGKFLGIRAPKPIREPKEPRESADRPPYPPGHPVTWGLITAGTLLAGQPYRYVPPRVLGKSEPDDLREAA